MIIKCYECSGEGCSRCKDGAIALPDLHDVRDALEEKKPDLLARIYATTLEHLTAIEAIYNKEILNGLDFESRTALDKQEKAILQQDEQLRSLSEYIAQLKAVLRASNFALDCLKLQLRTSKEVSV